MVVTLNWLVGLQALLGGYELQMVVTLNWMAGLSKLWGAFEVGVMVLLMDYLDEIFQPLAESCGNVLAKVVTAAVGKERRAG